MYVDDLSVVANSPAKPQAMLVIMAAYAHKWRYQINNAKSVIMVFWETSKSRAAAYQSRKWFIGESDVSEIDEQHHLGLLTIVFKLHCAPYQ